MRAPRHRQTGIALISMMLVFALAVVIATAIVTRNYRDIRRSTHLFNDKQAYQYALSGEQFARQILYRDFVDGSAGGQQADRLSETWAAEFSPFDIDNGEMTIAIHDLQGRFNINALVTAAGVVNNSALRTLRELQDLLFTSDDYAQRVVDWLDSDDSPGVSGAEFSAYDQGYLPANRALADISELRLIAGMDEEDYQKLAPHLVALPARIHGRVVDDGKYNINTADATLMRALTGLSEFETKKIEDRQQRGGYVTVADWLASPEGSALAPVSGQLSTRSAFFEVVVTARYLDRTRVIKAHLFRDPDNGAITLIKRQIGVLEAGFTATGH